MKLAEAPRVFVTGAKLPGIAQYPLIGTQRAAKYLGVTPNTLRQMALDGEIPAMKMRSHWKFRVELLDEWINRESGRGVVKHGSHDQNVLAKKR